MKLNQNKLRLALLGILPTIPLQIIFYQMSATATELDEPINSQEKIVYFLNQENNLQESSPNFDNQTQVKDLEQNITNKNPSIILKNQLVEFRSNKIQLDSESNQQINVIKLERKQDFIASDATTQFTLVTELDKKPVVQRLKEFAQQRNPISNPVKKNYRQS